MLSLYTDGSCLDNKNGLFVGWAYALTSGDLLLVENSSGAEEGTNNTAEMQGVIDGLSYIHKFDTYYRGLGYTSIEVVSDSQYVIKGMSEWMVKWKRNGWVRHSGDQVKNESTWKAMDKLRNQLEHAGWEVKFRHVRGHRGDVFNERVDVLAGEAARRFKPVKSDAK